MAEILKKLGEKAKSVVSTLKSLPPDSGEQETLRSNQEQVNSLTAKPETKENSTESKVSEQDKVAPLARYGSRPGEKRLDTSYIDQPSAIKAPIYDKGGDVSIEASERLRSGGDENLRSFLNAPAEKAPAPSASADAQMGKDIGTIVKAVKPTGYGAIKQPEYMPQTSEQKTAGMPMQSAPAMPITPVDISKAPVFDEGGDVNVNDGQHQVAILKEGEKVLTPEQAEEYRKEHSEEKGAPTDFGGRVIPNPKGLKPILDTDVQRATDTDRLPKGVTANIDNAPLKTPEGNISNPPAADLGGAQPTEASLKLKPYGKVIEEKANQKAAEQVSTVPSEKGAPTEGAVEQPKTEEKPKLTYGHLLAEKMGFIPKIDTNALQSPKEFQAPGVTPEQGGTTAPPQGSLKPINTPTEAKTASAPLDHKAQVQKYDSEIQAALDEGTAEGHEKALLLQEAKQNFLKNTPWGSKDNHPGIIGKLGHVGAMIAQRTPGLAPIVSTIPGSEGYRNAETAAVEAAIPPAEAGNAKENKVTAMPGYHQVTGGAIDPKHPELGPQVAFENEKDPKDIVYQGPITPKAAGGDKTAFEKTLAKIGTSDVRDPVKQQAAIDQAHTDKKITDDEYNNANAYLGSTANAPATQANAAQTKEDQKIAAGFRGKVLVFQNPDGSRQGMTYDQAKSEGRDLNSAMTYTPMAADKLRTAEKSYHNALQMFTDYERDVNKANLNTDDQRALEVLTSHLNDEVSNDYLSKASSGFLDVLSGEPLTGYSKKAMGGIMTKDQYEKMSPEARKLLPDYFQAMLAHFQSIKDTQGSIPRNPEMIRTEMGAIPLPYLSKEEAAPAFTKYFDRMHNMNVDTVRFGKPEPPKEPEKAAPSAPTGATDEVVKDGKVIGHVVVENGKKVYKALQQ